MDNCIIRPLIRDQRLLAQYYSMADALVICSKRETFPTTCLEAQCCGTPVVGFDTGGTRETSLSGEDDFVPYGDLDGLKSKLMNVLQRDVSGLSRQAFGAYSKQAMIDGYFREYGDAQRVMLLDVNCKYSSTGKIVYDLYHALQRDGRQAALCYGRGEPVEEPGILKFGLDWETNLHAALARATGYNGYFSPLSTRRLIRRIEEFKPDVIHIHELHAYFVNIKPLLSYLKAKNIRVVWTFHCEYMYTGKCGHAYDCTNFQRECGNCPAVREYPKSLFIDRTKQMLRMKKQAMDGLDVTIATPSQWLADRVKLSFLKDRPTKVVHNGIDTDVFHPVDASALRRELGIPDDHRVVLTAAPNVLGEAKGGQWVLQLAQRCRDEKLTFVLVGDTSKESGDGQ